MQFIIAPRTAMFDSAGNKISGNGMSGVPQRKKVVAKLVY